MESDGIGTVVVGVDSSPGSGEALRYALEDAGRRGARLQVVVAVRAPEYWATSYGMMVPPPIEDMVAAAREAARQLVDDVAAERPELVARVPVEIEARAGAAADVLVDASQGADLLVLGHRGRSALGSAVLGSVGLRCVLHASCPVTIVRPQVEQREQAAAAAASTVAV